MKIGTLALCASRAVCARQRPASRARQQCAAPLTISPLAISLAILLALTSSGCDKKSPKTDDATPTVADTAVSDLQEKAQAPAAPLPWYVGKWKAKVEFEGAPSAEERDQAERLSKAVTPQDRPHPPPGDLLIAIDQERSAQGRLTSQAGGPAPLAVVGRLDGQMLRLQFASEDKVADASALRGVLVATKLQEEPPRFSGTLHVSSGDSVRVLEAKVLLEGDKTP